MRLAIIDTGSEVELTMSTTDGQRMMHRGDANVEVMLGSQQWV